MDFQDLINILTGASAPAPAGVDTGIPAPGPELKPPMARGDATAMPKGVDTGIPSRGLPGPAPFRVADKHQQSLGAIRDSGVVEGLPRHSKPEGEILGVPDGAAQIVRDLLRPPAPGPELTPPMQFGIATAMPNRPELTPPMQRGNATAMPDAGNAPQAGIPDGMSVGRPLPSNMAPWATVSGQPLSSTGARIPTAAAPDAKAAEATNWPGLIRDILTSTMAGAATAQGPRAGNIGAFGTGYTTAENSMRARQQAENAAKLAQQRMGFEQTLATRRDSRDERGADRSDEELGLKRSDQTRKQAKTDAEIKKLNRELSVTSGIHGLALKDAQKLNDQLNQFTDKIKDKVVGMDEMSKLVKAERDRLLRDYVSSGAATGAAPVTKQFRGNDGKLQNFMLQNGQWVPQT